MGELLEFIDVLEERERQICLGDIFTTGLTPSDYSRFGKMPGNGANPKKVQQTLAKERVFKSFIIGGRGLLEASKSRLNLFLKSFLAKFPKCVVNSKWLAEFKVRSIYLAGAWLCAV